MRRILITIVAIAGMLIVPASSASATIHPIVQSVNCAAAQAWDHTDVGDPFGQTPEGFAGEVISVQFPFLVVEFPTPLVFDQSDFRALIATGVVDEIVRTSDGRVAALKIDLTTMPKAVSGNGGAHCRNAP